MDLYLLVKTLHILSASVIFGTGMGIAFFMLAAHLKGALPTRLFNAKMTVLADYCFTLPAVIIQPLSGFWLVYEGGYHYSETWLLLTYALYVLVGIFWIPVVFIQIRLRNILQYAKDQNAALPPSYNKLMKSWFILGWPAFFSIIAIFYLMVARPT